MWILGRHRHLSGEVLSEYLDGLLHGAARERVSRRLNACAACREELESLRATVSLLQELPDLPAPRSFTLAGPPPVPVVLTTPRPFRAPSWAYAGAASLAGLALALMVSADASGLLTPTTTAGSPDSFTASAPQPTPAPLASAEAVEKAATPVPESDATPQPESMQALRAAEAPQAPDATIKPAPGEAFGEIDQAPVPEPDAQALESAEAPPAGPTEESGPSGPRGPAGAAGPSGGAEMEGVSPDQANDSSTVNEASDRAGKGQQSQPVRGPASEPGPLVEFVAEESGTPLAWRVAEGVAAALLLVCLTFLLRRFRQGRPGTNQ